MHREMASFEGGDPFLSDAVGTTGKADIFTAAYCLSGHPLLPQHQMLLSLQAKTRVKYDEPSTLKGS